MTALKPPISYPGGKTSIAAQIAALLPPHEHYIELFAGSLAVLLAKEPSPAETVSDLDGELINFWEVLRTRTAELIAACVLTPHARAEQAACRSPKPGDDALERARQVWVRYTQSRGRGGKHQTWRYYQDPRGRRASMPDYLDTYAGRLAPAARRLHAVSLEALPALELISRYGRHPSCLLYADPPYLGSTRSWVNGAAYDHDMPAENAHRELLQALIACRAAVVISGYPSALYEEMLDGWHRRDLTAHAGNARDPARTEVLWSNRPLGRGTLFDGLGDMQAGSAVPGRLTAVESRRRK